MNTYFAPSRFFPVSLTVVLWISIWTYHTNTFSLTFFAQLRISRVSTDCGHVFQLKLNLFTAPISEKSRFRINFSDFASLSREFALELFCFDLAQVRSELRSRNSRNLPKLSNLANDAFESSFESYPLSARFLT